jgi:hypothetical protein
VFLVARLAMRRLLATRPVARRLAIRRFAMRRLLATGTVERRRTVAQMFPGAPFARLMRRLLGTGPVERWLTVAQVASELPRRLAVAEVFPPGARSVPRGTELPR